MTTLDDVIQVALVNRQINYLLMAMIVGHLIADIIVFRMCVTILKKAKQNLAVARDYLDLAAKHGQESDQRTARVEKKLDENVKSGVLPPSIVPPEARRGNGCGPTVAPVGVLVMLIGWSCGYADAAQELRDRNAAIALADWRADSP